MSKQFTYTILIVGILFISAVNCYSQNFDYKENSVYVYNFIKYTNWPQKKQIVEIGIVGESPLEAELKNLIAKKKNSNTNYSIRNIGINEAKNVDVIIVTKSASDKLKQIELLTAQLPILIITEKENMGRLGACISFTIDEDNDYKTEYQLSIRNCKQRGLSVNEQILNNAILIR